MAERPVFLPNSKGDVLVNEVFLKLEWHSGFAPVQKEKNIAALHEAARTAGYNPILEVSSKSSRIAGQHLSAFHLKVKSARYGEIPLECAFQGSKVFERGGPFTDLYGKEPRDAKRDVRLSTHGALSRFEFDNTPFPLEPKTAFYDWLYINCLYPHREWCRRLEQYAGFTDIEFNPQRSVNCQARSCALFISLMKRGLLDDAVKSPNMFVRLLHRFKYNPELHVAGDAQRQLFPKHRN